MILEKLEAKRLHELRHVSYYVPATANPQQALIDRRLLVTQLCQLSVTPDLGEVKTALVPSSGTDYLLFFIAIYKQSDLKLKIEDHTITTSIVS